MIVEVRLWPCLIPVIKGISAKLIQLSERSLLVESIRTTIPPINMAELALKFPYFILADVVPYCVNRKVCPGSSLSLRVAP
jgi:hypothetical protein